MNQGLDAAGGEFVLVLHSDVEVDQGIFPGLINGFEADPGVELVAPVLDQTSHAPQQMDSDENSVDSIVLTDCVDSCCFMVKHE